jgi:hypothetical protein
MCEKVGINLSVYFFLYAFIMLGWLDFIIFSIVNFIALLSVHVSAVAFYRFVVLH